MKDGLGIRGSASFGVACEVGRRDRDELTIAEVSQLLKQSTI